MKVERPKQIPKKKLSKENINGANRNLKKKYII